MGLVLPAECGPVITHQAVWMGAEGVSPAMSIVQGGGRIEREYGLGRMRTDLQLRWPYGAGQLQTIVLDLKLVQKGSRQTLAPGLEQTCACAEPCVAIEARLVIFDRRDRPWSEKLFRRRETLRGRRNQVGGM